MAAPAAVPRAHQESNDVRVDAGADVMVGVQKSGLRQRKKDATHQAIVEAAWELFGERRYADTSINDIADRANIAPRTFFRYFPSKEAVVFPEFDAMITVVRAAFFDRPRDEPVLASLLSALEALTDFMTEVTDRNQVRLQLIKQDNNQALVDYVRVRLIGEVSEMVLEREADRSDAELRAKLASGIMGLVIDTSQEQWLQTGEVEPLHDVGHRCLSLVQELLAFQAD